MDVIQGLESLFEKHAPETLLALFGAATSLLLFHLIGVILRQWFGLQRRSADVDASQDQATAALVEALVGALVTEAGHLRHALDGILEEALRRSEQNAHSLTVIQAQTEETPDKVLDLLRPEFAHLHQAINRAEARIVAQIGRRASSAGEQTERADVDGSLQEPEHGPDSRHSG